MQVSQHPEPGNVISLERKRKLCAAQCCSPWAGGLGQGIPFSGISDPAGAVQRGCPGGRTLTSPFRVRVTDMALAASWGPVNPGSASPGGFLVHLSPWEQSLLKPKESS